MSDTIKTNAECFHGGVSADQLRARGLDPATVVDLSSNVLFVEQPSAVRDAIASAVVHQYPDRDCVPLREAIAARHGIAIERVLIGNGCCELIHLVAHARFANAETNQRHHLVIGPTFSEYERAALLADDVVHTIDATEETDFAFPTQQIGERLATGDVDVLWICNPNNPTGGLADVVAIRRWIQAHPGTLFIIDESYIEFSPAVESFIGLGADNLVVLRSLTKSHAMAGLRLGYLVASAGRIAAMAGRRVPWSVSSVAQAAGVAALRCQRHYDEAMTRTIGQRDRLFEELNRRGLRPLATATNFFLLDAKTSNGNALRDSLLNHGVVVRDAASFGLPGYVRIAVGDADATERLLGAVDAVATGCEPQTVSASVQDVPSDPFRDQLHALFQKRRDVRHFRRAPVPADWLQSWLHAASLAPSVGLSQPWRMVSIASENTRLDIIEEYELQNELAGDDYDDETKRHYQRLKLAGLRDAPEQLAIFLEPSPTQGRGLGRQTMPETVAYSVVAAIQNFWLAARADGVGVGWVSILRPDRINAILDVPDHWQLIAYLCVGFPVDDDQTTPELERRGWEHRRDVNHHWIER